MITRTAIRTILAMAAALNASAAEPFPYRVDVCMELPQNSLIAEHAQIQAANIYAKIGVRLAWHTMHHSPDDAIVIQLRGATPSELKPGALGYALPYERTHIELFIRQDHAPLGRQRIFYPPGLRDGA